MSRVVRHPQADRDLLGVADYLDTSAGPATADRFLVAAEEAFTALSAFPLIGSSSEPSLPDPYHDVRVWPIKRFRNYLIFYRPLSDGVEILRVLHGGRDILSVIGDPSS